MSGRHSRNKGAGFERELVNAFKELGLEAQRVPLSGATTYAKGDVEVIAGFDGKTKFVGEAKRRKNLPEWIVNALGDHDFMVMREDRGDTLVMLRLKTFGELLQ
jgi:hypothetical protein